MATAAVNPNGTSKLFASGVSKFLINGQPILVNGARILPSNQPGCII